MQSSLLIISGAICLGCKLFSDDDNSLVTDCCNANIRFDWFREKLQLF